MKTLARLLSLIIIFTYSLIASSQIEQHAKFSFAKSKAQVNPGDTIDLIINVTIEKDWYFYANHFNDIGPIQAYLELEKNADIVLVGELNSFKPHSKFDDIWGDTVRIFKQTGQLRQTMVVKNPNTTLKGMLDGQTCSDVNGQCVPAQADVKLKLSDLPYSDFIAVDESVYGHSEVKPGEEKKNETIKANEEAAAEEDENSIWNIILLGFAGGLSALVTPCVFPMIPMTVSFFTKRNTKKEGIKKALIFGFSIIGIFTLFGVVSAKLFGPEFANILSTHWLPNILFFLIFVVFGASFLGMFDIVLPHGMVNKIDRLSEKGGLIGIFFMALTLVVVSFSCTAPIAGTVLILASQNNFSAAIPGMLAFSSAIALPFVLFAIFPSWLQGLPKSGGWLNVVKVVLGFIEIGFAFKFLSVPDQAYHWRLLDREIYLTIWIVLSFLLGMYLLGKIKLPHDSDLTHLGVPRFLISVVVFCFSVYMVPGLFGAPLKFLSGYLPPMTTQDFNLAKIEDETADDRGTVLYSDLLELPHGIRGFYDYKQALEYAKKKNKPLFIDFTGHGCVNCRKMEENVWSNPEVLAMLKNEFVVVALYVDEKSKLSEDAWYTSKLDNKVKKTIGEQNFDFQQEHFNKNAQPWYVLLGHNDLKPLTPSIGYVLDIPKFLQFLNKGLDEFKKQSH